MIGAALAAARDPRGATIPTRATSAIWSSGTIPVGIVGILLKHAIEGSFRSLWVVAIAMIVVGAGAGVGRAVRSRTGATSTASRCATR